jgi:hypothetical protein
MIAHDSVGKILGGSMAKSIYPKTIDRNPKVSILSTAYGDVIDAVVEDPEPGSAYLPIKLIINDSVFALELTKGEVSKLATFFVRAEDLCQ